MILARATGRETSDELNNALMAGVPDDAPPLSERLDAAGLTEIELFRPIKEGIRANKDDSADHAIRLKATRTGLELRGLLSSRGGVSVAASGNCQVNVGLSWSPLPSQLPNSNDAPTSQQSLAQSTPLTGTSTSEGTGSGRGGAGHSRSTAKSPAMAIAIPIAEMSSFQLKKYVPAAQRRIELDRRKKLRMKKNPRVKRTNKGESNCKSGKCGRCNRCRLEKRRIGTDERGPIYAK